MNSKILIIYTGGTIGMKQDPETLLLKPFNFNQITEEVPELKKFGYTIDSYSFNPIIDSSDVDLEFFATLASLIKDNYEKYDGFVVLHGTDTMAYSASALSFMLDDLEKPVIFTGSQLPIGMLRTDGKENLISSIELAAAKDSMGHSIVPEVCIYFESQLYRGNRTRKYNAENFRAFRSDNYPPLADVGIHIKYDYAAINYPSKWGKELKIHTEYDNSIAILKLYPGMSREYTESILNIKNLRAVILETYGTGNAPNLDWFIDSLQKRITEGLIVINVTQCSAGSVDMKAYANGAILEKAGVISGYDITTESALTKMYILLGEYSRNSDVIKEFKKNLKGEFSK